MTPALKCCKSCVIKAGCLNKARCHECTKTDPTVKNFKSYSFAPPPTTTTTTLQIKIKAGYLFFILDFILYVTSFASFL